MSLSYIGNRAVGNFHRFYMLGYGEEEGTAFTSFAIGPDAPPVAFDDLPRNGQPEARALVLVGKLVAGMVKAGEYLVQVFFRYADAGIMYGDQDIGVHIARRYDDLSAFRRILKRVIQQVYQHLLQLFPIDLDQGKARRYIHLNIDPLIFKEEAHRIGQLAYELLQ